MTPATANPDTDDESNTKSAEPAATPKVPSTRRTLVFVYIGYFFRYLYVAVLVPFYAQVLGAAEYGRVLTAMSLFSFVTLFVDYGFPAAGARDVTIAADATARAVLYGRHVKARLMVALPGIALGIAGTYLSPVLAARPLLGILATFHGVATAFNLGWYWQGVLRFRTTTLIDASGFAFNIIAIRCLVKEPADSWMIMTSLLTSSVGMALVSHALAWRTLNTAAVRLTGGFKLMRESTALFMHVGLSAILNSAPTYLFGLFGSATQVGWFGASERIASVGLSLLQPASQVMISNVTRRLKSSEDGSAGYALMRASSLAMTGFGVVMFFGALVLAAPVMPLILGPNFAPSVTILQIIAVMFPFAAFNQVVIGFVLIPLHLEPFVTRISFVGTVVTVLLVFALGHWAGEYGVAWSRVLGTAMMSLVAVLYLRQKNLLHTVFPVKQASA